MPPTELVDLSRLSGTLGGELADRLQHPEARLAELVASLNQRLVEERLQCVDLPVGHRLNRGEGRAAREDAEAPEELPFLVRQEIVAPGDRAPERALARIGVAVPRRDIERGDVEPGREPLEELLDREEAEPRGRELQREREPVETIDQGPQRGGRFQRRTECPRSPEEERLGVVRGHHRDV